MSADFNTMPEPQAGTAEAMIHSAAKECGWSLFQRDFTTTEWRRRSTHVCVVFDSFGRVVSASAGTRANGRNIIGRGKAGQILSWITA